MSKLLMSAFFSISLVFPASIATPQVAKVPAIEIRIANVIKTLQPKIAAKQAAKLAVAIRRNSVAIGVDWRLFVAILFQESSLQMDPKNCKANLTVCNDLGIGQVRYSVWGDELKIDKKRILTDEHYAIEKVAEVLNYYKSQYANRELNWFTRYHSKTPTLRAAYLAKLNQAYFKINSVKD